MKKNDSEKNYSPYVYKLAETIDYIGGKDALLFVEQWERVDADHLPEYITCCTKEKNIFPKCFIP